MFFFFNGLIANIISIWYLSFSSFNYFIFPLPYIYLTSSATTYFTDSDCSVLVGNYLWYVTNKKLRKNTQFMKLLHLLLEKNDLTTKMLAKSIYIHIHLDISRQMLHSPLLG